MTDILAALMLASIFVVVCVPVRRVVVRRAEAFLWRHRDAGPVFMMLVPFLGVVAALFYLGSIAIYWLIATIWGWIF